MLTLAFWSPFSTKWTLLARVRKKLLLSDSFRLEEIMVGATTTLRVWRMWKRPVMVQDDPKLLEDGGEMPKT